MNLEIDKLLKVDNYYSIRDFLRSNTINIYAKIVSLIKHYYKLKKKENKHYVNETFMFKNLDLTKLQELGNKVSQIKDLREYHSECFKKQFQVDMKNYHDELKSPHKRRNILKKIYEFARRLPKKF